MNRCALAALVAATATLCLIVPTHAGNVGPSDAISGASIAVDSGHTTDSSATLKWHENKFNGKLRLYWDTLPILSYPVHAMDSVEWLFLPGQVKTIRPQSATIPGVGKKRLQPGRTYYYYLIGFYPYPVHGTTELPPWPSMPPVYLYSNHGHFTTDPAPGKPASLAPRVFPTSSTLVAWDVQGRSSQQHTSPIRLSISGTTINLEW